MNVARLEAIVRAIIIIWTTFVLSCFLVGRFG